METKAYSTLKQTSKDKVTSPRGDNSLLGVVVWARIQKSHLPTFGKSILNYFALTPSHFLIGWSGWAPTPGSKGGAYWLNLSQSACTYPVLLCSVTDSEDSQSNVDL